jgi:hypothetical protein
MSVRAWFVFALALVVTGGCATSPPFRPLGPSAQLPPKVELEDIPFFPQTAYQCGPASLASALAWSGVPIRPEELTPQVYSPFRRGSLAADMIGATRRRARLAYPISSPPGLLAELAAGNPVIVLQEVGPVGNPSWHFALAIGYDLKASTIIVHSGIETRQSLSFRDFESTWSRSGYWGLVVLPPSKLPATVEEQLFLEAAVGLERARQWEAAAQAYGAARDRWPTSLGALIGLGNSRYAMGDFAGAEEIFRAAVETHPLASAPFNNLAHVLAEMGRHAEARAAAEKAVTLGGPLADISRATLLEIQAEEE